jgi:hypothetical protein
MNFAFDLWSERGSWFWRLTNLPNGRGIVGVAHDADEAAQEACAAADEIAPQGRAIQAAPALRDSVLIWNGLVARFIGAAGGSAGVRRYGGKDFLSRALKDAR